MKIFIPLLLGSLLTSSSWAQQRTPPQFKFTGELIESETTDLTTDTLNEIRNIKGTFRFDFSSNDSTAEDPSLGTYSPGEAFYINLESTSNVINPRSGEGGRVLNLGSSRIEDSVVGKNIGFETTNALEYGTLRRAANTVMRVRNNLTSQLSPEQTIGSDVIDIDTSTVFSPPPRTSGVIGRSNLNIQLIDSTGTALDSDANPGNIDFESFDTILIFYYIEGRSNNASNTAPQFSKSLKANLSLESQPSTLFRFTAGDLTFTGSEVPPITLLQGGWAIDYATPDSNDTETDVGLYDSGQFEDFPSAMAGFALGGDGSEDDFTSQKFFSLASPPRGLSAGWRNPTVKVSNGTSTPEEILGQAVPAGSDTLLFTFERSAAGVASRDNASFSLLLADPTGQALSSDALPPRIDFEDFAMSQVMYRSLNLPGTNFPTTEFEVFGPLTSFGSASNNNEPVLSVTSSPVNEGLINFPVTFTLSTPAQGSERFSFALESDQANVFEDFQPFEGFHEFAAGETSFEILFTLTDDATIEPNETFNLVLTNPEGLTFSRSVVPLTILDDDTLLDDYGSRFGLSVEERSPFADGDGDGLPILVEFAFNLDPTRAAHSCYEPGLSYLDEDVPFGLPVLVKRDGEFKYVFPRRTDAAPRVEYLPEFSTDGGNFQRANIEETIPLSDNWEEVQVSMPTDDHGTLPVTLLRVRIANNE